MRCWVAIAALATLGAAGALAQTFLPTPVNSSTTPRLDVDREEDGVTFAAAAVAITGCTVPGSPSVHYAARLETTYADGDRATTITDNGSLAADASPPSAVSQQPGWLASCIGSLPCFDFDGGDEARSTFASQAQPNLICAVARYDTSGDAYIWDGNNVPFRHGIINLSTTMYLVAGSSAVATTLGRTVGAWHVWCATYDGASSSLRRDGSASSAVSLTTTGLIGLTLGRHTSIAAAYLNGAIAELLLYDTPPAGGAADVEDYLECVYGAFPQ